MISEEVTLVILGATGDLTRRLLFPAIYRLMVDGQWQPTQVIGYAGRPWSNEEFCDHLEENLRLFVPDFAVDKWQQIKAKISYLSGDLSVASMQQLAAKVQGNALFYLGLPPQLFGQAATALGEAGLQVETNSFFRRLVIEKPFGWDLPSAVELGQTIGSVWREEQIFRIDHFLGKDTAQNVLVFRFINRLIESCWDANHIAQVQITWAETLGLEGRYQYYEKAGALRDMLQNHLMQLFTLVAMEPPSQWDADDLHNHKAEVLRAVRKVNSEQVSHMAMAGQYIQGTIQQESVPGYRQEPGVLPESITETYAAIKLYVDNYRWHGVPFYLRSGKRLAGNYAEIAIELKAVPENLFGAGLSNWLVFRMKPDEAIDLAMWAKKPGLQNDYEEVTLTSLYKEAGEEEYSAYEQLLLDVVLGDHSAFPRLDEVEESWRIVDPVLQAWAHQPSVPYVAGSDGPTNPPDFFADGQAWRPIPRS